jgi:hypothetical protein
MSSEKPISIALEDILPDQMLTNDQEKLSTMRLAEIERQAKESLPFLETVITEMFWMTTKAKMKIASCFRERSFCAG